MSIRDKISRKECWDSRDRYWECLDLENTSRDQCTELRRLYEISCPSQWVKHFDRKREYLQFKRKNICWIA
ncbi:cytochrome c oxidase assembly factor 6-like protein [Armadillidium vulgare]|nr:cytochrome c oxidase assembly factor 6-like protein [Armadillidium vulgare]